MPKRADDYMADRRDQILDAAVRCCWEKGWNQTTLRDVATMAGLSKGGVYVHFPTKIELLKGLLQRNIEQIEIIGAAPDVERFVQWALDNLPFMLGSDGRERAISQSELQLEGLRTPELRPLVENVVSNAVRVLEGMVRRFCPSIDETTVQDRALLICFFFEGLRNYAAMADGVSLKQLQRVATRQLRALLDDEIE